MKERGRGCTIVSINEEISFCGIWDWSKVQIVLAGFGLDKARICLAVLEGFEVWRKAVVV